MESSDTTTREKQGLNWTAVSDTDPTEAKPINRTVVWESIQPGEAIKADEIELDNASDDVLVTIEPSGTTFANDKALWRDHTWHPQISGTVPVGFGPKGLMISGSIWAIDCVTGASFCSKPDNWEEYKNQFEKVGDAQYNLSVGFGDAEKLVGVTVTTRIEETKLPSEREMQRP